MESQKVNPEPEDEQELGLAVLLPSFSQPVWFFSSTVELIKANEIVEHGTDLQ